MKTMMLFALLILSIFAGAQSKGDNVIILKVENLSFKELLKLVVGAGYEIESSSEDAGQISTRFKSIGKKIQSYRMKIIYDKDSLITQGLWKTGVDFPGAIGSGSSESIVAYRGPSSGPMKIAFSEMISFFKEVSAKRNGTVKTKIL